MTKQFSFLAGLFVCGFGYLNFSIPGYAALKESANICSIPASIATIPKPKQEVLGAATNIFEPSSTPTLQPPASTIQTATPSAGLNADVLFGMINNYRKNSGLPEFQKDEKTCQLARKRAP